MFLWLKVDYVPPVDLLSEKHCKVTYQWNNITEITYYKFRLEESLSKIPVADIDLDTHYEAIVNAMTHASDSSLSRRSYCKFLKPYWTPVLKAMHKDLMLARFRWTTNGKPRRGHLINEYKSRKRAFRRSLRKSAHDYEKGEFERVEKLSELDQQGFWKVLSAKGQKGRNKRNCEMCFDNVVVTSHDDILSGWQRYFADLYSFSENPCFDENFKQYVDSKVITYLNSDIALK